MLLGSIESLAYAFMLYVALEEAGCVTLLHTSWVASELAFRVTLDEAGVGVVLLM